jgi:transposase
MRQGKWASAPYERDQLTLFSPSVDDMIPMDHRVRIFDEILDRVDWTEWENEYDGLRGQPPIHPRYMAGAILYGLTERVRSSRELEKATRIRIDFLWLLHGRSIDHSTFSGFRTRFDERLRDLFRQLALIALQGRMEVVLAVDGTRIRSNSSRTGAMSAETIEKHADRIAEELSEALRKMELQDAVESSGDEPAEELRKRIATLSEQRDRLSHALEEANRRDEIRGKHNSANRARPVRVPVSDPDSYVSTNKDGGYAPNYTPTVAVDVEDGVIVSASVPEGEQEASVVDSVVEETQELTGEKPSRVLFDGGFATGPNLKTLSEDGIEAYSSTPGTNEDNPALRPDPSQPVPEEQWGDLPAQKKNGTTLTRDAFVYDREKDCYWCPMGQMMKRCTHAKRRSRDATIIYSEYRASNCADCPLASRCLSKKAKRRMVTRDEFEDHRELLRERMEDDAARKIYGQRAPVAEGTFAHIKQAMGIRQFLHRGIEKVRTEWLWVCAAFNVSKILKMA